MAISYPSKDRGRPSAKAPYDDATSLDVDEVLAHLHWNTNKPSAHTNPRPLAPLEIRWSGASVGGVGFLTGLARHISYVLVLQGLTNCDVDNDQYPEISGHDPAPKV